MASVVRGNRLTGIGCSICFNEAEAFVASVEAGGTEMSARVHRASMRPRLLWPRWLEGIALLRLPLRRFNEAEAFVASVGLGNVFRRPIHDPRFNEAEAFVASVAGAVAKGPCGSCGASMRPRLLWPRWQAREVRRKRDRKGFNEAEAFVASVGTRRSAG